MQCTRCGKEMTNTSGGNFHCPSCGFGVNDLVYRGTVTKPEMNIGNYGSPILGQTGWICPKCGRALSPWTSECPCYKTNPITVNNLGTVTESPIINKIETTLNATNQTETLNFNECVKGTDRDATITSSFIE